MSTFSLTLILATVIIFIGLLFLAIGWLLTGKSRFRGNQCGRAPDAKQDKSCGDTKTCPLCKPEDKDGVR